MALKGIVCFLASLLLTGLVYQQGEYLKKKVFEYVVKQLIEELYKGVTGAFFDPMLWQYVGDHPPWPYVGDHSLPSKYECPKSAVRYGGGRPHGNYIALREKDIEHLKKVFDSFEYSNNIVNVVYLYGVPGSGKSELARQFGNSVFANKMATPQS